MRYERSLFRKIQNSKRSLLLLGPRQTGKSTLIKELNPDLSINFAREQTFLEFSSQPDLLEKILQEKKPKSVFVDEIQRIPSLLNTIQAVLDENKNSPRFYLTGSSARKLRRGQANLLPGRLLVYQLGPLTFEELGDDFKLNDALAFGTLPGIWTEPDNAVRRELLRSYASTYLREEIQAEALTRNIEGFSRFLMVAASKSGEFLDYAKIGSQASISQKTSSRFFEILEDTLVVGRLDSFAKNSTRRLIQHPKFYFFDTGVLNGLLGSFTVSVDRKGMLFEHFIVNQIFTFNQLAGSNARLSTYRTENGSEVDLIIENGSDIMSVEIKATGKPIQKDFLGLKRFGEFLKKPHQSLLIHTGQNEFRDGFVRAIPWDKALREVFEFMS
ncbi:MAG: AAA family ATPase [Bdellovibrionaceae bacterium]|nr:AAA family ATPase [Pseudobdellovibrionaceae bacterium]